jgi:hypothetical protein
MIQAAIWDFHYLFNGLEPCQIYFNFVGHEISMNEALPI